MLDEETRHHALAVLDEFDGQSGGTRKAGRRACILPLLSSTIRVAEAKVATATKPEARDGSKTSRILERLYPSVRLINQPKAESTGQAGHLDSSLNLVEGTVPLESVPKELRKKNSKVRPATTLRDPTHVRPFALMTLRRDARLRQSRTLC
jgi:hypothetical protein